MSGMNVSSVLSAYQTQTDISKSKAYETKSNDTAATSTNTVDLGKTIGEPKLSEKAQKYYSELKKKFGQYDFMLVSSAEKESARASAGQYANSLKTVVLIDEEKIERMATDENYRKQYEAILSGATSQIEQIKSAASSVGANLKGVVMQVNDNGTTSFFAALQKTNDAQKERIEKKAEEKKAEKKAEQKKAAREAEEEQFIEASNGEKSNIVSSDNMISIMADSFEELIRKIEEYNFIERSNNVQTESELQVGQNIDFKG